LLSAFRQPHSLRVRRPRSVTNRWFR